MDVSKINNFTAPSLYGSLTNQITFQTEATATGNGAEFDCLRVFEIN